MATREQLLAAGFTEEEIAAQAPKQDTSFTAPFTVGNVADSAAGAPGRAWKGIKELGGNLVDEISHPTTPFGPIPGAT
jgi:hypothetical protein